MEVQNPMVFFLNCERECEHRPSSGDCDVWLGLTFEGRWGVSSTNLKFRIPTCIEPNHAQIRMRMEAGFQVFTFSIEISRRLQALNSPAGSAGTARHLEHVLERCSAARVRPAASRDAPLRRPRRSNTSGVRRAAPAGSLTDNYVKYT
jgi:hypothetical protein